MMRTLSQQGDGGVGRWLTLMFSPVAHEEATHSKPQHCRVTADVGGNNTQEQHHYTEATQIPLDCLRNARL